MGKRKWEKQAEDAIVQLEKARTAFSRAGLYLTSLLLQEAIRVGEYELYTELAKDKEVRKGKRRKNNG